MAIFLIAIDQTILASALPKIVTHFNALDQVTWVSSGFILTQTAFMPIFGQVTSLYVPKQVFLSSIFVFEVGSVICASAPIIQALILGRALAGVGAAGMMVSMITLMTEIVTLEKRAALMGIFGSVFGLASVIGPLVGGAFSDHVTWRWYVLFFLLLSNLTNVRVRRTGVSTSMFRAERSHSSWFPISSAARDPKALQRMTPDLHTCASWILTGQAWSSSSAL